MHNSQRQHLTLNSIFPLFKPLLEIGIEAIRMVPPPSSPFTQFDIPIVLLDACDYDLLGCSQRVIMSYCLIVFHNPFDDLFCS